MPDTSLSSSPSTPAPDPADRANSPSSTPSTGAPVSSCPQLPKTFPRDTHPSHKSHPGSSYNTASVPLPKPKLSEMPAAVANNESRSNKINSSTNNLFSSSCQPMRNTPNGESYAKVLSLPANANILGLYRHFHHSHDFPAPEIPSGAIQDLSIYVHHRGSSSKHGQLTSYPDQSYG